MRGIYCIRKKINNKVYIGQSYNLNKRKNEHFAKLKRNKHENRYLQNSYNIYGLENFEYMLLHQDSNISKEDLNRLEYLYIKIFETLRSKGGKGYNLCQGGNSRRGYTHSEETKKQMSIRRRGKLNGFYGKKHSKETIERMLLNKDMSFSQTNEYRNKISRAMKGRKFSAEHRRNKSKAQEGSKNPVARRIKVEGVEYGCIQDVADEYKIRHNTVSYRLNSPSERFKEWKYLNN